MLDRLYEVTENANVQFIGYVSERTRYDFAIVYTEHFFGKPLVICMQTGKSALLSSDDILHLEYLQKLFDISCLDEAMELSIFFQQRIPNVAHQDQY